MIITTQSILQNEHLVFLCNIGFLFFKKFILGSRNYKQILKTFDSIYDGKKKSKQSGLLELQQHLDCFSGLKNEKRQFIVI